MSFYDTNSSDFPWKQQPSSPDADAEAEVAELTGKSDNMIAMDSVNNSASSPSFNFGGVTTNSNYSNTAEIVVTDNGNGVNYTNSENVDNFHGDFGNATTGGGNYYFNNVMHNNIMVNNANNLINPDILNDSVDEESQVVPDSLDHLSRNELCQMIYRLDYERNTLQDKLQALRNQFSSVKIYDNEYGRRKKKGKKGPRGGSTSSSGTPIDATQLQLQQQQLVQGLQKSPSAKEREDDEGNQCTMLDTPPTTAEIESVQKRLGQSIANAIKSTALHGVRKIPKTTISETNLAEPIISAMMQNYDDKKVSETKRMIKWNFIDDRDIVVLLKTEERLIHPVKHDGSGYIMPPGSRHSNMYHWARFLGLEVKYDRRERTLTLLAKTVEAGRSGRPERLVEKARYSRGERDDFPG